MWWAGTVALKVVKAFDPNNGPWVAIPRGSFRVYETSVESDFMYTESIQSWIPYT
jgi:hypothetical protein